MAMTLVEASKLSNDVLLEGVAETVVKESAVLAKLPFIEIVGNGLTYNRENALPTVDFYDPGDPWAESTPTFTQATAVLKIMGGDADVDNFLKATRSNIQDLEAAVLAIKAKALKNKFEEIFLYGNATTYPKQFTGLRMLVNTTVASDQVIACGATGAALTLTLLDQLVDQCRPGKPDALIMSRRSRRKIKNLTRAAGFNLETDRNEFGMFIDVLNGIPFWVSDFQLDTHTLVGSVETATTGATSSVIYAVKLGESGLAGLTSPGGMTVEPVGSLETKDATRTRIKWYVSMALFAVMSAAALIGVTD
jgi:hypothetical protein